MSYPTAKNRQAGEVLPSPACRYVIVLAWPSLLFQDERATQKTGATLQLSVKKIKPAGATDQKVKWTSDNPKVATVDSNGKVKATGKGTCNIVCTAQDGSGAKATVKITVK